MTRADVCMRCRLTSSARRSAAHTATRRRAHQNGTLRAKWQCRPHGAARSGPSGSAARPGLHAQGRVAVRLTLPLDVERTKTVRSGPSGSATRTGLHAQGRVAAPPTLPLDGERTGQRHPHCHSTSSAPKRYAQGQVAVWVRAIHGLAGATPMLGRALSEPPLEQ